MGYNRSGVRRTARLRRRKRLENRLARKVVKHKDTQNEGRGQQR